VLLSLLFDRSPLAQRRVTSPITGGASFAVMAGLVAYGDLVTKWLAVTLWSGEHYPLFGRMLGIEVVHNPLGAFSLSLGPLTREINIAATVVAVLLSMAVSSRLARLDRGAPESLGLIAGAGIGNLTSMVGSTAGVPDFLALSDGRGGSLVLNVADVAAYIGIACCLRLAWIVVRAAFAGSRQAPGPASTTIRPPGHPRERPLLTVDDGAHRVTRRSLAKRGELIAWPRFPFKGRKGTACGGCGSSSSSSCSPSPGTCGRTTGPTTAPPPLTPP
jgi:lipoprotein signal peptidase